MFEEGAVETTNVHTLSTLLHSRPWIVRDRFVEDGKLHIQMQTN